MEGYSIFFCGISIILIPTVGVIDLHWVAFVFCITSGLILTYEYFKEIQNKLRDDKAKQHVVRSEPALRE